MSRFFLKCSEWFPLWLVLGSLWAWWQPDKWTWFQPWISLGLGVIMLGMGLTLTLSDFRQVVKQPRWVAIGVILQFVIMPTAGWFCAKAFGLSRELSVGLLLVACCPGGTAGTTGKHPIPCRTAGNAVRRQCFGRLSDPPGGTSDVTPQQVIALPRAEPLITKSMGVHRQPVPSHHVHSQFL